MAASAERLQDFARQFGILDTDAFVQTMETLDRTGRLPSRYLTKGEAEATGWKPGQDLWRKAPGKSIGGDGFANRERLLPGGLRYIEADLDYRGGPRNAKRLIVASNGRRWITVDHYQSFHEVPQ
ncbi:MAG: ribonuclease [Proteobacteria bacterium]|nr:ribonuclease [Pseudomonadota bacterium]MBI3499414.1 ribonuclease [Pseudomonadota bacterium]